MQVTDAELTEVVEAVWSTMLGLPLSPAAPTAADGSGHLTGCIHITGSWEATLVIEVPQVLARDAAASMFDMPADDLDDDLVLDALGEIANMVGGNVKGLVGGDSQLSLPAVTSGSDFRVTGSRPETSLWFDSAGHPLSVHLVVPAGAAPTLEPMTTGAAS
jgi:chemotaxis protein CheX